MKVKVRAGTSTRRRRWLLAPAAGAVAALAFATTSVAGTPNAWTPAQAMSTGRFGAAAALLPGGKVLVAGGEDSSRNATPSAELYDPVHDTWSPASDMNEALDSGEAAVLADGSVLVVGASASHNPMSEVYDAENDTWTTVTAMQDSHIFGSIVPLAGGDYMVVGGSGSSGASDKVEIYDPVAQSFSPGTPLPEPRLAPAVAPLPGGRVLVAGGVDHTLTTVLTTALVYDPASGGSWTPTANTLSVPRAEAGVATLAAGKVLIAGGATSPTASTSTAEIFDPATDRFTPTGSMSNDRALPGTATLADGRVVVAGGGTLDASGDERVLSSAEAYDPATGAWSAAGTMSAARFAFPLVSLPDDELLAVGGSDKPQTSTSPEPDPLASVDRYTASTAPGAPGAVSAAAGSGSAFVSWAPPASDGGLPILHYTVTAAPGGATVTTSDDRTAAIVPGLANGVSYTFTVRAVNVLGAGAASAPSNAVTPSAPAAPPAVTPPPGKAPDTKAPKVKIAGLHSRMTPNGFLGGVHVRIRPSEPSTLDVSLVGYAREARVARTYNLTLARRHTRRSAHTRKLTLKPRKRLVGHARRFRVQLRVVATDRAGNRRTTTKTIKVAPRKHHHKKSHHR